MYVYSHRLTLRYTMKFIQWPHGEEGGTAGSGMAATNPHNFALLQPNTRDTFIRIPRHRDRYVHYMSNINPLDFQLCTPTVGMTLYQEPGDRTQINDLHKIFLMNSLPSE